MINLITTYYKTSNEERNNEIDKCLKKNIENKYIKKIYLLNNKRYDIEDNKIIQVIITTDENYKLKYSDAISFINNYLQDDMCILSNSDIYFNDTLAILKNIDLKDHFFALLRYDEDMDGNVSIFKRHNIPRDDSQDCWIFQSPLQIDLKKIDFSLGTLGCDSTFAYVAHTSGIKVSNPSYDIVSIHVHNTGFRTYNDMDRIHGKYCLIKPCGLLDIYGDLIEIIDY
jgi:hypothetical protein